MHTKYYLPTVEINDFFDQLVKNNLITYDNIRIIAITECLLDYNYFNNYYKMIAIDLSKKQALDADPKAIQQTNFTGNLENNAVIFFIIDKKKEVLLLDFSQGTVNVLQFCFCFNIK